MTPYERDCQTNRIAWLIIGLLMMLTLVALVRHQRPAPAAAPQPHAAVAVALRDAATNAPAINLGDLDIPGAFAASHGGAR